MSDHADSRLKLSLEPAGAVWGIVCFQKLNPVEQLSVIWTWISEAAGQRRLQVQRLPQVWASANELYACGFPNACVKIGHKLGNLGKTGTSC